MARFVIRKLGATGDACIVVSEQELADYFRREFAQGFSAAICVGGGARFLGNDLDSVLSEARQAAAGREEIEFLLIPRVEGG